MDKKYGLRPTVNAGYVPTARPSIAVDRIVFVLSLMAVSFVAGLEVGAIHSAVELKPCPQAGKAQLVKSEVSGQVCTYATIEKQGRKFRFESKTI